MVVRMAEDPKKQEAKQKLRFFKNGKDKAEGEAPEPEDSTPQAVATEEVAPVKAKGEANPAAEDTKAEADEVKAEEPKVKAEEPKAKAEEPKAKAEEPKAKAEEAEGAVEERKAPADEPGTTAEDAPAGDAPADGAPRSRRRERVQAEESEPESKETVMSHLLPSLMLGFRTLVILAIIIADAFAAYMLTTKVIAPKIIEAKIVDLRAEIGQLPPEGGMLPKDKPARPAVGLESVGSMFQIKDIVVNPSGTNGTRYLCTTVALEITDPVVEAEATAREAQVRDLLIEILSRRTVTELSSLEMRDHIRDEIGKSVNTLLTSGEVDGVYFSNFVLQ
jgi:flagellar basal body-associated protein FliL